MGYLTTVEEVQVDDEVMRDGEPTRVRAVVTADDGCVVVNGAPYGPGSVVTTV